jgi:nucleotide-binding universal stress UspA family protein
MGAYRKILVLLDCSPVDEVIVNHVAILAKSEGASVVLSHVVHSHTLDQDRTLRQKAVDWLDRNKEKFVEAGVPVDTLILSGEPEVELVKEIESGDYDLIALATHGHKLFSDILFGSVSDHLKHEIFVPILLIRGSH